MWALRRVGLNDWIGSHVSVVGREAIGRVLLGWKETICWRCDRRMLFRHGLVLVLVLGVWMVLLVVVVGVHWQGRGRRKKDAWV